MPNCAAIIVADPESRAAAMEKAAAEIIRNGTSLLRVGNPLSAPLTLRRLLIQLEVDGVDGESDEEEETRLMQLLERRAAPGSVTLFIEQAETLEPATLLSLQRLATGSGSVKIVFVGSPAFWGLLDATGLEPLRRALALKPVLPATTLEPDRTAPPILPVVSVAPEASRWIAASSQTGRRWWIGGAAGLFGTLAAAVLLAPGGQSNRAMPASETTGISIPPPPPAAMPPPERGSATQEMVAPEPAAPPAVQAPPPMQAQLPPGPTIRVKPQARPSTPPTVPSPTPGTRMQSQRIPAQSEFEQFLAALGYDMKTLSDDDRSALLGQFLAGKSHVAVFPDELPSPDAHVVIHYTEGSTSGEMVNHVADEAARVAASVQTRVVEAAPAAAEIRFFHSEDAVRARELAGALHDTVRRVAVRNFVGYQPSPPAGTIEIWLPRR